MRGRARLIASIAVVVVVLLLSFVFLVRPKQGDLGDLRDQVTAEEQRTISLQTELARLEDLQERAPELEAELAELEELVPDRHGIPNFIFLVQDAANSSGVGFVQITPELPKSPPEGAALAEVRVQIGARGGYFAIQDFMRRLYDLDRAVRIDILTMAAAEIAEEEEIRISLDMTSRIFFELPAGGAPAPTTPTAPGSAPAPVATPEATPVESPSPEG